MINNAANTSDKLISISIAYAPNADENIYLEKQVALGTTIYEALNVTGFLDKYPELKSWCDTHQLSAEIDQKNWRVGVYSQKKLLSYSLQEDDRIEIYRPLTIDPMNKRKKRAGGA